MFDTEIIDALASNYMQKEADNMKFIHEEATELQIEVGMELQDLLIGENMYSAIDAEKQYLTKALAEFAPRAEDLAAILAESSELSVEDIQTRIEKADLLTVFVMYAEQVLKAAPELKSMDTESKIENGIIVLNYTIDPETRMFSLSAEDETAYILAASEVLLAFADETEWTTYLLNAGVLE